MVVVQFLRSRRLGPLAIAVAAAAAVVPASAQGVAQRSGKDRAVAAMPSFLDKSRVPDLVAARAAIATPSAVEAAEQERAAEARLMSETDALARRAEEERALAAEIRAKAEALSQRFAQELPADKKAQPMPVLADAKAQDERTAETMKRAAEALGRARRTLDEVDQRSTSAGTPVGAWETVKAEIADARRKAAEAVASAEKALGAVPAAVAAIAATGSTAGDAGAAEAPKKKMTPPYALGGTLR